jgi:serine/threonine protein kinase
MSELTPIMGDKERLQAQRLSQAPAQPPLGVSGYEQERFLGRGAFGEVWMAVNSNVGKRVAIKFYSRRGSLDWSLLSREVEKLSFLFHDRYVVQLLEVGWDADPPYYVMEYMERGSLEDRLANVILPVPEAVEIFQDIATGLVHAHDKGILHCDLKPANILLDQDFKPRLADFGQARLTHEQSPALGTLFYMAPEQADLVALPNASWDVYALGAILYRMLTGDPPHRSAQAEKTFSEEGCLEDRLRRYRDFIRQAPPPMAHRKVLGMDAALARIIDRCLVVDPHRRYPNVQAVLDDLHARRRQQARRPLLILGLALPALVLLVMAGFAVLGINDLIRWSHEQIAGLAQKSNHFAAESVAQRIALDLDKRWRILERYARKKDFQEQLTRYQEASAGSAKRKAAQRWIQQWLDTAYTDFRDVLREQGPAYSWFVSEATQGIQVARHPYSDRTVGKPWWQRDYFHGLGQTIKDKDAYERKHDIPRPITRPHRSVVFVSQASHTYCVAFSVPVKDGTRILGVLGMTMEVGTVPLNQVSDWRGALIDMRPSASGVRGLVIAHPLLKPSEFGRIAVSPDVVERCLALEKMHDEYHRSHIPAQAADTMLFEEEDWIKLALLDSYQDPLDPDKQWLAALAPVVVQHTPEEVINTGWFVVVQEPQRAVANPVQQLRGHLLGGLVVALVVVMLVIGLSWGFVFLLSSETFQFPVVAFIRRQLGMTVTVTSLRAALQTSRPRLETLSSGTRTSGTSTPKTPNA